MNILAVNSSDDRISVAVNAGGRIIDKTRSSAREHNRFVLTMIQDVLSSAQVSLHDIDAVAFGAGPGSFTGLRISAGVAQGIAFGIDAPVVAVSCMAAIAQRQSFGKVVVALDAKQSRIHWGCYVKDKNGLSQLQGDEFLTEIDQLAVDGDKWLGAGSGWDAHGETLMNQNPQSVTGWTAKQSAEARELALLGAAYHANGQGKQACQAIPKYSFPYITG